jgi:hypothetical protein
MKKVYAEVWNHGYDDWQGGIVIFENGTANCPGLDQHYNSKEKAIAWAEETAIDYVGECNEQGVEAEYAGTRINE